MEATPKALARLEGKMEAGRRFFPLPGADILQLLRSVKAANAIVRFHGIEETARQKKRNKETKGSRDRSLSENSWDRFVPGRRNVILFGCLHCASEDSWLFGRLRAQAPAALRRRMLNIRVAGEQQSGPVEAFVYFLDAIGIEAGPGAFVITDTRALHPRLYEWFQVLDRLFLKPYASLVVFRPQRSGPAD